MIIGNALIETSAIFGIFFGYIMLSTFSNTTTYYTNLSELGILFSLGFAGSVVGYISSLPVEAACLAIARQPFFSRQIQMFTLIMQSIMQTPTILAFIIALLIKNRVVSVVTLADALRLIGAGISIGIGSIGPTIGLGIFLAEACSNLGINRKSYGRMISFSLISEAMITASVIFSLIISLFILNHPLDNSISSEMALLTAGLCMGLGTIGVGIGLGKTAAKACHYIGINPDIYNQLSRTSILAQALIEAQTIYVFIIAIKIITS
jgi:F0F1-type ATP synthase membrane subunit c/vacuolar-type H+-ATPase subunit K